MQVVVDTNRIISALLSKGKVFEIFLLNESSRKIDFIAPEFLFFELGRNFGEIIKRSKLSTEEISFVFELIKKQVNIIPLEEFNEFSDEALKLAPHEKDKQYFALALANGCGIWSDESFRKQSIIEIFSTGKLFSIFLNDINSSESNK